MKLLFASQSTPDLLVEILGILGNLTIAEFDFAKLATSYDLLSLFRTIFSSSISGISLSNTKGKTHGIDEEDDVLLEVVIFIGTMGVDENVAPMMISNNILKLLIDVMRGKAKHVFDLKPPMDKLLMFLFFGDLKVKEEDDEIILQVCFCIYQYLLHDVSRAYLIDQTGK